MMWIRCGQRGAAALVLGGDAKEFSTENVSTELDVTHASPPQKITQHKNKNMRMNSPKQDV